MIPFDLFAPASLLARAGLPLPSGEVPAGVSPAVVVGTAAPHPADVVEVFFRRDGGPARVLRAVREAGSTLEAAHWFRALLPEARPGAFDEYRVELSRAGQLLATLPADGAWLGLRGAAEAPAPERASDSVREGPPRPEPRFDYRLDFFATLTADLRAEPLGATPEGYRANFFIAGGQVIGPGIEAELLPEGGDWMHVRPDGVGITDVRVTWRTRDGALILDRSGGVFDLGPNGYAKIAAGDFTGSPPLYVTPTWSTAHPGWRWLNRCQGFGIGRVVLEKLQVQCDLYLPRVGERRDHG